MDEKLSMIAELFRDPLEERVEGDNPLITHGRYHGGIYNGRKYMYSETLIQSLPLDRLRTVITKQIGI